MSDKNKLTEMANYFGLPPKMIMGHVEDYLELYDQRFEDIFDDELMSQDEYIDGMEAERE